MTGPVVPPRERPAVRPSAGRTAPAGSDLTPEQQAQLDAEHALFDFQLAEKAELLREHEALQALLMEQLKNEDEIMKKWIALI